MPTKLSKTINLALEPLGVELRRTPSKTASGDYYPVVPTCQVPYLSEKFEQFLGRKTEGAFVEVGAYDGYSYSNTWGLARRGWRGLLIEPIEQYAEECRRAHARHPGVSVVCTAIAADESGVHFHLGGAFTTASTEQLTEFSSKDWAKDALTGQQVTRPSQTLDSVLLQRGFKPNFDVLVVDVEGFESAVFSGFDLRRWKPRMMIVELADSHPQLTAVREEHARLYRQLQGSDYDIIYKDAINTVFVRSDVYDQGVGS